MQINSLDKISSENYLFSLGPELPPKAMREVILSTQECKNIRKDIEQGIVTDELVGEYVHKLFSEFKSGERFSHDLTLATLAVCYENYSTTFAKEFISDLASLRLVELSISSKIANECLKKKGRNGKQN